MFHRYTQCRIYSYNSTHLFDDIEQLTNKSKQINNTNQQQDTNGNNNVNHTTHQQRYTQQRQYTYNKKPYIRSTIYTSAEIKQRTGSSLVATLWSMGEISIVLLILCSIGYVGYTFINVNKIHDSMNKVKDNVSNKYNELNNNDSNVSHNNITTTHNVQQSTNK